MAKQKLVAKVRFDDGSKKGENGKSHDYEIGEVYVGADASEALKKGLVCSESDLKLSKEVLDEKDKVIRVLEDKLDKANKQIDALQKKLDAGGNDEPVKAKPGRKPKAAVEGSDVQE